MKKKLLQFILVLLMLTLLAGNKPVCIDIKWVVRQRTSDWLCWCIPLWYSEWQHGLTGFRFCPGDCVSFFSCICVVALLADNFIVKTHIVEKKLNDMSLYTRQKISDKSKIEQSELYLIPNSPNSCALCRLEQELRRLKAELQSSRQSEQELRSHVCNLTNSERSLRPEVSLLRQSNMLLQSK